MNAESHVAAADPRSILVILPTWVGDFVMATPALRAIRDCFPQAHITFLMESNLGELIRGGNWMNECIAWPARERRTPLHREFRDLIRDLRGRKLDLAVLLPNSFRSAAVARLTGAKRRVGYDRDGRGWLLTDRIAVKNRDPAPRWRFLDHQPELPPDVEEADGNQTPGRSRFGSGPESLKEVIELAGPRIWPGPNAAVRMGRNLPADLGPYWPIPMVEYYADLMTAMGCQRPGDRLELFVTADCEAALESRLARHGVRDSRSDPAAGPLVIISPGAKFGASKCWLPQRYAEVADRLIESASATILITCGPGEEPIAREIARHMRHPSLVLDQPLLSLGELKSLVRRGDLLLCTDSGPRHIAKAFGVSAVTLFGSTHPDWTATSYERERIVRMDVDCGPCQQKTCPLGHHQCMTGITAEIVYAASMELLSQRFSQRTVRQAHG